MVKINQTFCYAIRGLIALGKKGEKISGRILAVENNMPERFLLQVLKNLVPPKILISERGANGGFMLHPARSPHNITLLEVYEALEGRLEPKLPNGLSIKMESHLCKIFDEGISSLKEKLRTTTISDLLAIEENENV